jgi:hypothetical protein
VGVVRVDGELLARGSISFIPVDDKGAIAGDRGPGGGANIEDGKYRIEEGLKAGLYRVEIQGTKKTGNKVRNPVIPSSLVDEEVPVVPRKYNSDSELTRQLKAGVNPCDFKLEGIQKRPAKAP